MMGSMATNPLTELIPAEYRKYVYLVAATVVFVYGLWSAADGDWVVFGLALAGSLVPALAASNMGQSDDVFYDGHDGNEV